MLTSCFAHLLAPRTAALAWQFQTNTALILHRSMPCQEKFSILARCMFSRKTHLPFAALTTGYPKFKSLRAHIRNQQVWPGDKGTFIANQSHAIHWQKDTHLLHPSYIIFHSLRHTWMICN
jgi:hypothetical protein